MEKDYIKIYQEAYSNEYKNQEIFIKSRVFEFDVDEDRYFEYNNLNKFLIENYSNSIVLKEPYRDLTFFFENKSMAKGKKLKVITKYLTRQYENLNNKSLVLNFEDFLIQLAIYNAKKETARIFSRLDNLLGMMNEVKNFSEFELNESFAKESSAIYKKYRQKCYPNSVSFDAGITLNSSILDNVKDTKSEKKKDIKNFQIKNKWLLDNEDYFDSLTYDFINEKKTSFKDFK